ncbi:hypothetical protein COB21_04020 [Candidatus Aerophobetes bacterium]|uniref:Putative gluconeogenesis factor n=1 Tax=Aerophobetes bacterium TaxID=2030807 RepID=A0A2A4X330_UNCAE|nr:MAG: hypothetical protein COB21_04020 [Candidatus Aerophobetes bacterium]
MKKIVVIGGGTGNFTVLSGLKNHNLDLTAVVSMADDGGSTGILRDELGVLPPGDVRQCLVALSNSSVVMRSLMNYRFDSTELGGHSVGNLLISALQKVTGSFERAIEEAGKILSIQGRVLPVTTHEVRLKMILKSKKILEGEKEVYLSTEIDQGYDSIFLEPYAKANPHAIDAILNADLIIMGPGGLHTSLIPNLLVEGVADAIATTKSKKLYISNLMNRKGQTTGYKVSDYYNEITKFIGKDVFDWILVNDQKPSPNLIDRYRAEGELTENDMYDKRIILAPLLGNIEAKDKNDFLLKRNLIRHNSSQVTKEIMKIVSRF